jgi:inosine-uridine nucleoside N-ribohydrolase
MRKISTPVLLLTLLFLCTTAFSQTKIILDTDFGGDADDLGALAMLHHFIDKGECDLLAINSWSTEQNAVSAIDATNRYYHHPNIPIGVRKDGPYFDSLSYNKSIADHFYHELSNDEVIDATILYRKVLAASKDSSITIVAIGPLKNIEDLIRSEADSFSSLSGPQLIRKKVKEFVIMGGQYPEGKKEWNFNGNMPGVTKFVIDNLDVPITFSGYELGLVIKTGAILNIMDKNTPLYIGFKYFSEHAPWVNADYRGKIMGNSSFDETAVLYAVRNGVGLYWDKSSAGRCIPDDDGGNTWAAANNANQSYLKLKMDPKKLAEIIDAAMLGKL